jgi:hypothetical protein
MAVFHIIWTAPGKRTTADALLRSLRKVDRRLPETEVAGRTARGGVMPEMAEEPSFTGLLARLRKVPTVPSSFSGSPSVNTVHTSMS